MATFDTQINSWVQDVQFRDASAAQLALYNSQMAAGTPDLTVQKNIIDEGSTLAYTNPVVRMYQAAFGRIPDLGGQKGWVNQLQGGQNTIPSMANWFADAPEFKVMYNGATSTTPANKTLVDSFYFNVLQRAPDAQGEAFWISSGLKAGQLLAAFSESAEFIGTSTPQAQGLQQLNIQSQYPTNVFVSLFATPSYNQVISGQVGFQLTPNADTATSNQFTGNLIYNPNTGNLVQTITTGDNLTGAGTNPTLTGQLQANASITTNGVSTFVLQSTANSILNGNLKGLTTLTNNGSTANLTVNNVNSTALTNLNLSTVLNNATTTVGFGPAVQFGTATSLAIGVSGGSASGAVTLNSGVAAGYTTLAVSSTGGSTNTIAQLAALNSAAVGTDTTLTIAGDTALRLQQVDTTLTTINAGALTTGGTAFSGNLTLGSAANALNLAATTGIAITGGSGQNKIFVQNFNTAYNINGGTGTSNTLVFTGNAGVGGGTATNFKTLELAGVGGTTGNNSGTGYGAANVALTLSGVTGLSAIQLDGAAAGNTGTVTIVTPSLTGNALTLNLVGNGLVGTENFNAVTFAGVTGTANALTVNVSNQGVSTQGNLTTLGAMTLNGFNSATFAVTDVGAAGTTLFNPITDANLTTLKVTSPGNVTFAAAQPIFTAATSALTALDLSGVTGTQTVSAITMGGAAGMTTFNLSTGAGNATVAGFTSGLLETTFVANAAGNLTFTAFSTATAATVSTETFTETGGTTKSIIVPDHLETSLTTLSLSGNVAYQSWAGAAISTPGAVVVTGATDNANSAFNLTHGGAVAVADVVTLGNGNNLVTDVSSGAVNINLGTGFNTVTLSAAPTVAGATITFGAHNSTGITPAGNTTIAGGVITAGTHDAAVLAVTAAAPTAATNVVTVTGTGVNDIISVGGAGGATVVNVATGTDANLAAFFVRVAAPAVNTAYVETFGTTTYIISDINGSGSWNAGDFMVGVTGTHTFGGANAAGVTTFNVLT